MKFGRNIDRNNRIFYDPISNQFLINGKDPIEIPLTKEYDIIDIVEQSEIAGLSQEEILCEVARLLLNK